jgi:hypothetical protein
VGCVGPGIGVAGPQAVTIEMITISEKSVRTILLVFIFHSLCNQILYEIGGQIVRVLFSWISFLLSSSE